MSHRFEATVPDTESTSVPAPERQRGEDGIPVNWEPGDVVLDLYEVRRLSEESPYAEGGMGRVNRVWHRGWQMDLAVKSVNPQYLQRPGAVDNFLREAEVWVNKLNLHPNLVFCYYVRLLGGLPRIFVEYIDGGDLTHWVESGQLYEGGQPVALGRILDVATQFAWGLHAIHTQGLVHQDVKPRNVLMTRDGVAKVTDFGIARARAAARESDDTASLRPDVTALAGTRSYQSPEQAAGERLTAGTDVWSWAVSVLDLFLGKVERGFGPAALMALEQYVAQGSPDQSCPVMPPAVVELLRRCFQSRPEDRPQSLLEVAVALREIHQQVTGKPHQRQWVEPAEALADSLNNRALSLYDSLEKRQEAEAMWQEALHIDPLHPEATYNWGLLQWRAGQITDEHLLNRLEAARVVSSQPARVDYLLGSVHLERNDAEGATEVLTRAHETKVGGVEVAAALQLAQALPAHGARPLHIFAGHTQAVAALAFSADGRLAISGGEDRTLRLWEVFSGRCLRTFEGDAGSVTAVALSPDGRFALAGSQDHALRLWEVATGRCLRSFLGGRHAIARILLRIAMGSFLLMLLMIAIGAWIGGPPREPPRVIFGYLGGLSSVGWIISSLVFLAVRYGSANSVRAVAWRDDGSVILCGSADATLRQWSGSRLHTHQQSEENQRTEKAVLVFGECPVTAMAFGSDGGLVLWGKGNTLGVREVPSGRAIRSFVGPTDTVAALAWSPDCRFALSGSADHAARLWEVSSGRCLRVFHGHRARVTSVAWSPDGRLAVSASDDCTVRVWEVSSGRCLRTLAGHNGPVTAVACSSDGQYVLSASTDHTLRLWRLVPLGRPMALAASRPAPEATAGYLQLLHQARAAFVAGEPARAALLLAQARRQPGCWRRADALELARQLSRCFPRRALVGGWQRQILSGHRGQVTSVGWSPDGRLALSGSMDGTLRLWETASSRCLRTFETGLETENCLAWSPDGRYALSGGGRKETATQTVRGKDTAQVTFTKGTMQIWEISSGRRVNSFEGHAEEVSWIRGTTAPGPPSVRFVAGHTGEVTAVAWSRDGRSALSGSRDRTLRIWDPWDFRGRRTFGVQSNVQGLRQASLAEAIVGRGCLIIFVGMGGIFGLLLFLVLVGSKKQPSEDLWMMGILLSYLVPILVAGWWLWRWPSYPSDRVTSVAWGPDDSLILSGCADKKVRLWQASSGRVVRQYKGHTAAVTTVAFSPDGRLALSGSEDHTLRLWEVSSGRCLRSFAGHQDGVTSVAWSTDGHFALSGSEDQTLRLWDVSSGRCLQAFTGHTASVTSVALSPDGWLAVSGSADHTVRIWQLDWELLAAEPAKDAAMFSQISG